MLLQESPARQAAWVNAGGMEAPVMNMDTKTGAKNEYWAEAGPMKRLATR